MRSAPRWLLQGLLLGGLLGSALGWQCQPNAPRGVPPSAVLTDHLVVYFEGQPNTCPAWVYRLQVDTAELRLINGANRTFSEIAEAATEPYHLLMNAGMFHRLGKPVGYFINDAPRRLFSEVNTDSTQRGNFFMVPNGLFYLDSTGQPGLATPPAFLAQGLDTVPLQLATQSGPMLLMDGAYHPAFRSHSNSRHIRNGVGLRPDGTVVFICTADPVNFYTFATMFLEEGCPNALYLDGAISGMYISGITADLNWFKVGYGPVLGVVLKE